jgi:hypothetical protein
MIKEMFEKIKILADAQGEVGEIDYLELYFICKMWPSVG